MFDHHRVTFFNVVFNCAGSSIVITREEEIKLFPHSLALIFIDVALYSLRNFITVTMKHDRTDYEFETNLKMDRKVVRYLWRA